MKKLLLVTLTLFAVFFPLSASAQVSYFQPGESLPDGVYQVDRVIDGDTLVVRQQVAAPDSGGVVTFIQRPVRVLGIDSPELRRAGQTGPDAFATDARNFATAILANTSVVLLKGEQPIDRYGRALAYVVLPNGMDYSAVILSTGLARYEAKWPVARGPIYKAVADGAKSVGKGVWEGSKFTDVNCGAFSSRAEAQAFFVSASTEAAPDRHKLDPDKDGLACESLRR